MSSLLAPKTGSAATLNASTLKGPSASFNTNLPASGAAGGKKDGTASMATAPAASAKSGTSSGKDTAPKGSSGAATAAPAAAAAGSGQPADFDVFSFLQPEARTAKAPVLRDPVLQQMSVVRYEGELDSDGFFHGYGKLVSTLGYVYAGHFAKGLMDGTGRIEWSDGTVFEGDFVENTIHGSGRFAWPSGDWYEGGVVNGVRNGQGTFFFKHKQQRYEGGWTEGKRHGTGALYYTGDAHGVVYRGDWVDDRRTGHGEMVYPNDGHYTGEWLNDQRHGQGVMQWTKGGVVVEEYRGQWANGQPHGLGTCSYIRAPPSALLGNNTSNASLSGSDTGAGSAPSAVAAHNTYTGEFQNGQRHGTGTFVYDDGSRYEGGWVQNVKHGEGKYTTANGVVYFGTFAQGNPTTPIADVKPPESTVACPLPLYIRDVLGEAEQNVQEAILAVQSLVSRHNGLLRKVFQYYAALEQGVDMIVTPANWRSAQTQGTIHLLQFLRLCSDAKLITRHCSVAAIDRVFLAFKDRTVSTQQAVYLQGADGDATPSPNAKASATDVVANTSVILPSKPPAGAAAAAASAPAAAGTSAKDAADKGRQPSVASSTTSGTGTTAQRQSSLAAKSNFQSPWDQYKNELHSFNAELNFRDCVEALIRVSALLYRDGQYGTSLAHRFRIVVEEHVTPFCATGVMAISLCPLTRENKTFLSPHVALLQKYFKWCAVCSALSPTSQAPNAPLNKADVTVTLRQVAVLLKRLGCWDEKAPNGITLSKLCKILPYDKYPQMTAAILRKQYLCPPGQHMLRPAPPSTPGSNHGGGVSSAVSPAATLGPAAFAGTLGPAAGTVSALGATTAFLGVTGGDGTRSSMSLAAGEDQQRIDEAGDAAFKNKSLLLQRSVGFGGVNHLRSLCMEAELTFSEFVEVLVKVAVARGTENTNAQRISAFFLNYLQPLVKITEAAQ